MKSLRPSEDRRGSILDHFLLNWSNSDHRRRTDKRNSPQHIIATLEFRAPHLYSLRVWGNHAAARRWFCGGGAGCHDSKSAVCQILPAGVRANRRKPSDENQTRSIGPPAGDASDRSTTVLPTRRHSRVAAVCAQDGSTDRVARIKTVAQRHTNESIFNLFHVTSGI